MIRKPITGLVASVGALVLIIWAFTVDPELQPCWALGLPLAALFIMYQTVLSYITRR